MLIHSSRKSRLPSDSNVRLTPAANALEGAARRGGMRASAGAGAAGVAVGCGARRVAGVWAGMYQVYARYAIVRNEYRVAR